MSIRESVIWLPRTLHCIRIREIYCLPGNYKRVLGCFELPGLRPGSQGIIWLDGTIWTLKVDSLVYEGTAVFPGGLFVPEGSR
jgi:hypothetical protein